MKEQAITTVADLFGDIIVEDAESEQKQNFSMWIDYKNDYVPAVNLKTTEKIPSGVYKVTYSRDDYHIIPIEINTDELYRFSEDFTDTILKEVEKFWDRKDIYKKYNFTHKRGLLLVGAPGNGKTACINLLIKQLIQKDGLVFFLNSIKEFNMYVDVLKPVIRTIEPERPIITIIEDIDQMIENMNNDSEILDLLDGKNSINHHLVILTSNDTSTLSPALLRPSRIDMVFEIVPPGADIRKEFFIKKGIAEDRLQEYVDKTDGMSFAELKEVFTGTVVLDKSIDEVVSQIKHPMETKNYLDRPKNSMGV